MVRPPQSISLRRLMVSMMVFAAAAAARPSPLDAAEPREQPSPEHARRLSATATFVPFGVGIATILVTRGGTGETVGGMVSAIGLEVGPTAGYGYAGMFGKSTKGLIGRTVLLAGAGIAAASVDDSDTQRDAKRFLFSAAGLLGAIGWAAHDIRRVAPLVEAKNGASGATSASIGVAPALDRGGRLSLAMRARF